MQTADANKRQILVTCALPYANGAIHLGHMLEHIQADIWVRFQRLQGNETYFICADDAHGTPIMLKAEQLGISPELMIEQIKQEHESDFTQFNISFDNYHSTHSKENKVLVEQIYCRLKKQGYIKVKTIAQLFDNEKSMFLPDRFVKGSCPNCAAADQYGDNCEVCGSTYSPTALVNPKSILSSATPVIKESEHYFFDLPAFENILKTWIHSGTLQKQVANKMQEWFNLGLQLWDISRDSPYFGFKIPDAPGKYFYVWLDAPVGYMASFKKFTDRTPHVKFADFWNPDSTTELYHFIGKDIVYFHSLFWPAMLTGSQYRKPTNIFAHGYVTVNGEKMSKSRGTFIQAKTYLQHFDPDCLRYYYATKLTSGIDDIDLNLVDFAQRVNSDLVNKVINLASRCAGFISKWFDCQLSDKLANEALYQTFINKSEIIASYYEERQFAKAMREIMILADKANRYIDEQAPWIMAKKQQEAQLHAVCTMAINLFAVLMTYLKPVVPGLAERAEQFLNITFSWNVLNTPLLARKINPFIPLLSRIDNIDVLLSSQEKPLCR